MNKIKYKWAVAELTELGEWKCLDHDVLEKLLNENFAPANYSPADGDPHARATADAAAFLNCEILENEVCIDEDEEGRIY